MSLHRLKEHEFLRNYLQYVHNTESPSIMHIWSALGVASACMARHVYLETGIGPIFANEFILLVGPPGTRKSTALGFATDFASKYTNVRFAPDDTGSHRQGLITALEGDMQLDSADGDDFAVGLQIAGAAMDATDIESELDGMTISTNAADGNHMLAAASEFGTFMGEANAGMTRFLNKVYDGEDYHYKLKAESKCLKDPLMTVVGCTTTSDIAKILPAEAIGQGFMSRWLLVFAAKKEKRIAEPSLDLSVHREIAEVYGWLGYDLQGRMTLTQGARDRLNAIYMKGDITLNDSRFIYYAERRHSHLQKLCMILAATRKHTSVDELDVELGLLLLENTETGMPDALGEFGLSPIGAAKQKLLEFLQHTNEIVSDNVLWAVMQRDMKFSDFRTATDDLVAKEKVRRVKTATGTALVYVDDLTDVWQALNADLVEES